MKRTRWRSRLGGRDDSRGEVVRAMARHPAFQRHALIMEQDGQSVPYDPTQSIGIEFDLVSVRPVGRLRSPV